jgi:hypothetical protein
MSGCRVPHGRLPVREEPVGSAATWGRWLAPPGQGTPRKFFGEAVKTSFRIDVQASACRSRRSPFPDRRWA